MITEALRPFEFEFFTNALIVTTVAGALCGLIGTFVVLKGMSYIGHGLSHAIFGGFAASALIGVNFFVGAGLWGFATALLVGRVTRRRGIGSDAAIGVITTASFALGIALLKVFGQTGRDADAYLFGQVLGVNRAQVLAVLAVMVVTAGVVFALYRPLLFTTFDPEVADVSGVSTARIDAVLMLVLAVAILATMNVLGVVLVAATLVIPAVTARMLTNSFARMLLWSTSIGALTGFVGMNGSYHLDVPSGASIVLTGSALFAVVYLVTGRAGRRRAAAVAHHGAEPVTV